MMHEMRKEQIVNESITIPAASFVDGGGLYDGFQGGNYGKWHSEQELKQLVLRDLKKAGVSATIRFGRGGWTTRMTMTIKLSKDDIKTYQEYKKDATFCYHNYIYGDSFCYQDENRNLVKIPLRIFEYMDSEKHDQIVDLLMRRDYDLSVDSLTCGGCCHGKTIGVLRDSGNHKYQVAQAIVSSYNRDCSNAMIDYFDRSIYDHYTFKIV